MIDEVLLKKVADELTGQGLTVATAESCTGGLIAHMLTNISGSSDYFDRGVISYSNTAKVEQLDVSNSLLKEYGAVSKETAEAMAVGIKNCAKVDLGIATTGIAGPTGGTKEKPVGLVYIGIVTSHTCDVRKFLFSGNRLENKESTCNAALQMILDYIK